MTKDKIIELAREAGFVESNRFSDIVVKHSNGSWVSVYDLVENLINISRKYEREQCADIVENADTPDCGGWTAQGIADDIRARSNHA